MLIILNYYRFGKPVRLQICYRSDKEPDFFTAHSFVHVMNLKPIRNIQSGEETLEVFLSYSEVVPLESMFVHNVDQITDDKEKFEALLISNISRLKRIFGDRCAEYYFLSHFLASQPNQGYVMRYKPRGANGAVTSLMHINSRKNAFVLNVAAPGVLHNTDVCLEQLFLERFWRETLNAEKAKNLYVYNLEVSQREATFRVAEFGWTKIYKVVPYTGGFIQFCQNALMIGSCRLYMLNLPLIAPYYFVFVMTFILSIVFQTIQTSLKDS